MAKPKTRGGSAAKRREQQRQQRQDRMSSAQSQTAKGTGRKRPAPKRSPCLLIGGTIVLIAVIVGFFIFLSNQSNSNSKTGTINGILCRLGSTSAVPDVRSPRHAWAADQAPGGVPLAGSPPHANPADSGGTARPRA